MLGCAWFGVVPGGFALPIEESSSFSAPTTFGIYRVLHQTGSGVLGPVFRAFDPRHDRIVAIKTFHLPSIVERVTDVAEGLRRLAAHATPHPGIVLPLHAGIEGTTPFMVMAHQAGETLDVVMRRLAPAPPEHVLPWLARLAGALDAAAGAGLEHGALHPRDILLSAGGDVAIVGFGVVRTLEAAAVPLPTRRPYSAPECGSGAWDRRADLYSLAVIAHEVMTGRRPLGSGEQDGEFAPDLPPERRVQLRRVLARALADSPAARYPTAKAFIDALEIAGLGVVPSAGIGGGAVGEPREDFFAAPFDTLGAESASSAAETDRRSIGVPLQASAYRTESEAAWPPSAAATRRWSAVAGLVAVGIAGALGGHLAVRALRPSSVAVGGGVESPVEHTEVFVHGAAANAVARAEEGPTAGASKVRAAAAVPSGRLWIRSEPSGALVTIDGRRSGQTPAFVDALPFGTYAIQVGRSGYTPRETRVTLGAEAPERRLSFSLRPGVQAAIVGGLDIASRPRGARVLVDGRFLGSAPLRIPQLRPGTYTVTLELAGYQSYTGEASVSAGALTALRPTLRSTSR